ncbi:MAG: DUF2799 domain-containing protein [Parvularculaceae bacterium]
MGLRQYCKPSNGFAVGSNGGRYYGVCTGAEEGAFTTAYQRGEQLFSLESDLARANAALDEADARLADVQNRITHAELALVSPETPNPERLHILADMKAMHEEEERIKASFRPLRAEHRRAQEELADYRAYLASNGPYPGAAQGVLNANY